MYQYHVFLDLGASEARKFSREKTAGRFWLPKNWRERLREMIFTGQILLFFGVDAGIIV